ncbi:hypothetical protein GH714_038120 [Hevea brasiliensis]|uniref:Uncharacterized protein n=1 Tax=Hevea brasiliensis TaxID=3981 RepID=A0A6A6MT30_HEVBR|nr:hypothetical protein GH714_038120 [Hevea brasiliensis]
MLQTNGTIVQLPWQRQNIAPTAAANYYRATLDYNGVFTQYAYPRGSNGEQSWSIVQYIPEDICSAIFNELGSGSVDQNDPFGGCKPNFPLGCGVDDASENLEELYELQDLQDVNWPLGDYESRRP